MAAAHILSDILLDELGHVRLVSEQVAGDARGQQKADNARDAAAQLDDGRVARQEAVGEERVRWRADPLCKERGDLPDDFSTWPRD